MSGEFNQRLVKLVEGNSVIVDENQAVIVETLKTANMMKNHNLARAIGDAGWARFITKLEYKAAEKGVHLVKLDIFRQNRALFSRDAYTKMQIVRKVRLMR